MNSRGLTATLIVLGCLSAAVGCDSGHRRTASTSGARPTATGVLTSSPAHPPCPLVELQAGDRVPGWRLGAVQFQSADDGVGLTATSVMCFPRGQGPTRQRQPVWLVATRDGGRSWRVTGTA